MNRGKSQLGVLIAVLVLAGLIFVGLRTGGAGDEAAVELTPEQKLRADDRIAPLLVDCPHGKQFTIDTSNIVPILVESLATGNRDPLRAAKQELALIGEPAVKELRRVFDEAFSDKWRHGVVENILNVCALMETDAGLELSRFALGHPQETVRLAGVTGVAKHGGPTDFDQIALILPLSAAPKTQAEYANALFKLDVERAGTELATWMEEGRYPDLWQYVVANIPEVRSPETVARFTEIARTTGPRYRALLRSPAARDGDEKAIELLLEDSESEFDSVRKVAYQALHRAGLTELIGEKMVTDPSGEMRAIVADMIGGLEPSPQANDWLTTGLSDSAEPVRKVCLEALLDRGDERALAEALQLLRGSIGERDLGIDVLRNNWDANPGSARRAYDILVRAFEEAQGGSASERISILQTISQVPGDLTARFLVDIGSRVPGEIRGLRAHRFCTLQAANAGPGSFQYLRERLALETDPLRRIDLIFAISIEESDASREVVREILLDDTRSPFEQLYAAERLINMGPAAEVAPFLKRSVYLKSEHVRVRPALQCLLWQWYGPREVER